MMNIKHIAGAASGILLSVWLAASANAAAPIKIDHCEWILFQTEGANPQKMSALRIVAENGKDGFWLADPWLTRKPEDVLPMLEKLKGLDASDPEAIWETALKEKRFPGIQTGVDIALWDLCGRSQGKPVAELLGSRKRDKVALYLAGVPCKTAGEHVALALAAKKRNAHGFKIYAYLEGYGAKRDASNKEEAAKWVEEDIQLARAVREAVGDSFPLMFYNNCCYNFEQAVQVGKALDELHYSLFYDPMPEKTSDSMARYIDLGKLIKTPVSALFNGPDGGSAKRIEWIAAKAAAQIQTDVYGSFTPCLQVVRACEKAGVPLDLHGGFPTDYYQFPLYAFVDNNTLPMIGWHLPYPGGAPPIAAEFKGSLPGNPKTPWIKRIQNRPVDADGYVHLVYDIPGMGVEYDWDWIKQHDVNKK